MRAPVVTISCPSCGGTVKAPKPGATVACSYCGTELSIPDLTGKRVVERVIERVVEVPESGAREPQAPRPKANPAFMGLLVMILLVALLGFVFGRSSPTGSTPLPVSEPPALTPEQKKVMSEADCLLDCNKHCEQGDPMAYADCSEKCMKRCENP